MKKTIIVLSFFLFTHVATTKAQVPDTLAYLQNIVNNKSTYVGMPFSTLMNNLQIQIKFFSPFPSLPYDKTKETSTDFGFYLSTSNEDYYLTYPRLEIYWQTPLNANQSYIIWNNNNGGGWAANAIAFYNSAIIADIKIRSGTVAVE